MRACLKTFCCCCPLKAGVQITGCIFLVVFTIVFLLDSLGVIIKLPTRNYTAGALINKDEDDRFWDMGMIFLVSSLEIIASTLIIVGANEGIAKLLIPWIFVSCCSIVGCTVYGIMLLFQDNLSWKLSLFLVFWIGLLIYLLMVVLSHYVELKMSQPEERINLNECRSAPINPTD